MRRAAFLVLSLSFVVLLGLTSARAYQRPWGLERVSLADDGSQAEGWSPYSSISADGRFVAFNSTASNLVPADANGQEDIFVRDRLEDRTTRVSVASDGTESNGQSFAPNISADGRVAAFVSFASNLVPGVSGIHVYVHDLETHTTELADVSSSEAVGDLYAFSPSVSADGRFVVFESNSSNLVPNDTNGVGITDVFVRDRLAGTTERVSVASDGTQSDGNSKYPTISADGTVVAFDSEATNLVPLDLNAAQDPLFRRDAFVHDRVTHTTELVSVTSDERQAAGAAMFPVVSATGRYVAFVASASNLVQNDGNRLLDVFVRDRALGITERVSVSSAGREGDNSSLAPSISADGRLVVFGSDATNLVPGDVNRTHDSFIHDRLTGETRRLSVTAAGADVPGQAITPRITPDGGFVSFGSFGPLVEDDTNSNFDVYVVERGPGLGVADLSVSRADSSVHVEGAVTMDGAVLTTAEDDPAGDPALAPAGVNLDGASVAVRPESEDLRFRWDVAAMPSVRGAVWTQPGIGGVGPAYQFRFTHGGSDWLVQGTRLATRGDGSPGLGEHEFFLYECRQTCLGRGAIQGSIGTTGESASAVVPLAKLEPLTGGLGNVQAALAIDPAGTDVLDLPDTPELSSRVDVAVVARGQEPSVFEPVGLSAGRFTATLDVGEAEELDVVVRVCRAGECVVERVPLGA